MVTPTLPERIQNLEDEVQALDSQIDARTRKIWIEIIALKAMMAEVQAWMREVKSCRS